MTMNELIQQLKDALGEDSEVIEQISLLANAVTTPPVAIVVAYHPLVKNVPPAMGGTPLPSVPEAFRDAAHQLRQAAQELLRQADYLQEAQQDKSPETIG